MGSLWSLPLSCTRFPVAKGREDSGSLRVQMLQRCWSPMERFWPPLPCLPQQKVSPAPYLPQVELQDIADIMGGGLGQLHQLLPVLKRLAELLHAGLDAVNSVDALQREGKRG